MRWVPFLLIFCGCSPAAHWNVDEISAGNKIFDSSRLRYIGANSDSPLSFELLKIGNEINAFINLNLFHIKTPSVDVLFALDDGQISASLPVHQGGMRLRVPPEISEKITQALQEGRKVSILVEGFEETLDPDQFVKTYNKFLGNKGFLSKLF